MLMLFPTIKVPGLDDIEIFRDHEKQDVFYVLRGRPRIAEDDKGNPQLSFYFFSRNADIAYASSANKELVEAQLGQLLFTADLSISAEEHKTITDYLTKILQGPAVPFTRIYNRIRKLAVIPADRKPEIKLSSPNTWKEGVAKLEILEGLGDTFVKQRSSDTFPTLIGSNAASFYATFGIEGSQLTYDALTKGYATKEEGGGEELTPLQAIVRYELKGYAYIPAVEVRVTADSTQVYNSMQSFREDYSKYRRGSYKVERTVFSTKTTDSRSVMASKEDIRQYIERMVNDKVIKIEFSDFSEAGANTEDIREIQNTLKSTLIETVMNTILPSFFNTAFIGEKQPAEGEPGATPPSSDTGISAAERDRPNVTSHYYFREDIDKTRIDRLNFHYKQNTAVEFRRFPNGTLITQLTPEQRAQLVKYIDIGSPEVQMLEVQIGVNANFEEDKIHSIIVNIIYNQTDAKTGMVRENSKSFLYQKGDEIFTFRVTMARNAKGELLDYYSAEAKISYLGTADSPPPIKLENISDRKLIISYDKLGFVTVNCFAGDINWDVIKEAIVTLTYEAAPDKPDTKKEIRLSKDSPSGNWRCYMYGNKDNSYTYQVKYIGVDGKESQSAPKKDTRGTLLIDDQLIGKIRGSFDLVLDSNSVKSVKVEILYEDKNLGIKKEDGKWFNTTETWEWSIPQSEGATDEFKYRHIVQYTDDIMEELPWTTVKSDEDIKPMQFKRYPKTLTVDGGMIDWTQWDIVYASVSYSDADRNYNLNKNLRLTKENILQTFEALAFTPNGNPFKYTLQYAKTGGTVKKLEEKENTDGLLIIENPAP